MFLVSLLMLSFVEERTAAVFRTGHQEICHTRVCRFGYHCVRGTCVHPRRHFVLRKEGYA
ncbi:hypothetical protein J437_LFUL004684 [Ladona fulva]|uniref:Defensin n=1 Tax=Ladona fulva TaxID=123851 RepID=A0A8K0KTL4_LADFU|nr:hypothetical protein J437_LFUL004684 [Ladona fulva]